MYLTPQRILLAGATGLTGEHLLDFGEQLAPQVVRTPTGQQLEEHDAEGVHVRGGAGLQAAHLLR